VTKAERWKRVEELYHTALEQPESDRKAFLESACAQDETLRREVESLLGYEQQAADFIEQPALKVAALRLVEVTASDSRETDLPAGTRLGSYEVISLLDTGGMGKVYRARDTRLGRDVALKMLIGGVPAPERVKRFEREARTAGSLNHPNVLTVHDVGTHEGAPYLVTELLDGATLRERLLRGRLSTRKAGPCQ